METNEKELPNIDGQDVPRQDWQDHLTGHHLKKGGWRRIHHSWIFWIFLLLMLSAIAYYIASVDFAFAPRTETTPPTMNRTTP
jgi:hypothetical protein